MNVRQDVCVWGSVQGRINFKRKNCLHGCITGFGIYTYMDVYIELCNTDHFIVQMYLCQDIVSFSERWASVTGRCKYIDCSGKTFLERKAFVDSSE